MVVCFRNEKGQVLLIVTLAMVVALTVGLSVVSRSIVQLKTSTDQTSSEKAFSAAEAGIEQVLKSGTQVTTSQSLGNNASINTVTINSLNTANILVNQNTPVLQDIGTDIWLSTYGASSSPSYANPWSGTFQLYWGNASSSCSDAAIEISVISGSVAAPIMSKYAYDPCPTRRSENNFSAIASGTSGTVSGQTYNYSVPITVTRGLVARVVPLYSDTIMGIIGYNATKTATKALPSQGKLYTSTGVAGNTQRQITYFQGYDSVPTELFYSLFSPK